MPSTSRALRAVVRAPAVHFLVLGALLAAADARLTTPAPSAREPIVITAARVAEIRDEYQRTVMVAPTAEELAALVAREADEEMLYREALLLGLDRGDRAVKYRVVDKVRFLYGDDAFGAGDAFADNAVEAAYRRGLELGLERDDVVVKNTLVTKMRLLARAASRSDEPTGADLDRELTAYLDAHAAEYAPAARVDLTHVFVSNAAHGGDAEPAARALLERLRTGAVAPAGASRLGDPFVPGTTFRAANEGSLAKVFGDAFATAALALEPGRWSEPLRSPYGVHLVWVSARDGVRTPTLEGVRSRVLLAYRAERRARYLERMMAELRAAYPVEVERAG